ncbi:Uncharacterized conserved protein YutE, UPF0331/DUF86 family [Anoxybacillus pushchinoensis]|jgi:uncharacterized protein YutE (UPF0331/DUF86 family)|uniref:Uncharacterized conserved protein YutE, UPF0331/DUF86 family n=1 Tax=Anoxybacillus pushchinoensis TaxID=150248 RepID=A0A1I0SUN9_9BACL|nr:DUF86 domain-containing protein [Anoxybacillus pushchinoensis]SFA43240.1 Uncharacterized conserved protein YutE, UPF0331/DUF86 family [Anoxybacillus pushchinoensis]
MYFVDRQKIEKTLTYMEQTVHYVEQSFHTPIEKLALERIGHVIIESIIDVGNAMIDGFIMRDPGSYEDIIDILVDERVVSAEEGEALKQIIHFRKKLVQQYIDVPHAELLEVLQRYKHVLQSFPASIRSYLQNELGPVSAFLNENV